MYSLRLKHQFAQPPDLDLFTGCVWVLDGAALVLLLLMWKRTGTHARAGLKVALLSVVLTRDWEWPIWELFCVVSAACRIR